MINYGKRTSVVSKWREKYKIGFVMKTTQKPKKKNQTQEFLAQLWILK